MSDTSPAAESIAQTDAPLAQTHPGTLYLLPNRLADGDWQQVLPAAAVARIAHCRLAYVENAKPARAWLRALYPELELRSVHMHEINPAGQPFDSQLLAPVKAGADALVISDAGCPGVADPGAAVVRAAHQQGIRVVPLVGPSSILLTLMASGLQGQRFAFHGYLPVDASARRQAIQMLATRSATYDETQLVIETPYRNAALWEALLGELSQETLLTAGVDLTSTDQWLRTYNVRQWRNEPMPPFDRRPTVMAFLAPKSHGKPSARSPMTSGAASTSLTQAQRPLSSVGPAAGKRKPSGNNPPKFRPKPETESIAEPAAGAGKRKPGSASPQRKLGKSASR